MTSFHSLMPAGPNSVPQASEEALPRMDIMSRDSSRGSRHRTRLVGITHTATAGISRENTARKKQNEAQSQEKKADHLAPNNSGRTTSRIR